MGAAWGCQGVWQGRAEQSLQVGINKENNMRMNVCLQEAGDVAAPGQDGGGGGPGGVQAAGECKEQHYQDIQGLSSLAYGIIHLDIFYCQYIFKLLLNVSSTTQGEIKFPHALT